FSILTTGPDATITSAPDPQTRTRTLTFSFSSQTPGVTFECQIAPLGTTGSWQSCTSGVSYGPQADGTWLFQVRANDGLGNTTQPPAQALVRVDNLGPGMSFLQTPGSPTQLTDFPFMFVPTEPVSKSLKCRLDGGPQTDCSTGT